MDKNYIIFQENGLFGAKYSSGRIAITPKYKEMYVARKFVRHFFR